MKRTLAAALILAIIGLVAFPVIAPTSSVAVADEGGGAE
jgi:hypothetical protein